MSNFEDLEMVIDDARGRVEDASRELEAAESSLVEAGCFAEELRAKSDEPSFDSGKVIAKLAEIQLLVDVVREEIVNA